MSGGGQLAEARKVAALGAQLPKKYASKHETRVTAIQDRMCYSLSCVRMTETFSLHVASAVWTTPRGYAVLRG
jgi:hypothetical protein